MGYEEVETVLPADFVPRPDPVPVPEMAIEIEQPAKTQEVAEVLVSDSEPESDAEDATCGGKLRKKKKKRSNSSRGRNSILSRWRSSRSKSRSTSRGRSSKTEEAADAPKEEKKRSSKSKSKLRFHTIKKSDSNATEVASNTTKAKAHKKQKEQPETVEEEVAAINYNTGHPLPTVREGSPDNTTITALTGDNSQGEDKAVAATGDEKESITSPSPAPSVGTELSVEVGDENEQFEIQVDSPFNNKDVEEEVKVEEAPFPAIMAASSKDASVRSTKSNRSMASVKSNRSIKFMKSTKSEEKEIPDIAAALSNQSDAAASVRSSKSTKSTKSTKSISSQKSSRSTKSTSSKRSLKSLKLKSSKPKEEALVVATEAVAPAAVEDAPQAAAAPEENTSDKENEEEVGQPPLINENSSKGKWVKKVSLSIGGYKTSFQFSDPMANLASAVNDALNVVGGDEGLAEQAKVVDEINKDEESQGDDEERDYDENPTRLFMYLQQRAWGLALTQLQKHPDEAKVWVYRKTKPEKAPNVPDADKNPDAMVVQHTALIVHDGSEAPKFRWKLLPLHAAIVLGAPTEIIQEIIRAYPNASKKTDERGSLPVHLAASRLDVDPEGEKVVLQLFGAYPDSIELSDRKGRTPPELAKLARARKEIEEQRRAEAASQASQIGVETTESQHGMTDAGDDGSSEGSGDADDDRSVKSSLSGRFQQLLRKSKSTDTVDRRKKRKKKKPKLPSLSSAKSMDGGGGDDESTVADDATIAESLGPGFAFVKTSEAQEQRELSGSDSEEEAKTEEEILVAAKKAMVSREYLTPEDAPVDTLDPRSIPLPMSFSMGDDSKSVSPSPSPSAAENRSSFNRQSLDDGKTSDDQTVYSVKTEAPKASKSVTISEEPQVHEPESQPDASSSSSDDSAEQVQAVNEGLRVLLEKAVENAGRGGVDVTTFVKILEDEWVTDVEALRRLDGETLDDLLPLMLSRELQRLINHADSIDSKFLKEDRQTLARGRSPKKSTKKKKKKRSNRKVKKRSHYRPVTPPEGPLTPISEETDSPASVNSDDHLSIVTEARSVFSSRSAPPKLKKKDDDDDEEESEMYEGQDDEEDEASDLAQSASIEDLEIRRLHANLIADARKKFPTREALEDSIRERQASVEAAVQSGFDVDKETLARAALADDEVRKLLPLRLILPTAADLTEMIGVLQMHKMGAIRELDMDMAKSIQSEIDELQDQIDKEERYLLKKRMRETKCLSCGEVFPVQYAWKGVLKTKEKQCEKCRDGASDSASDRVDVETVDSRDDEDNN